MNKIVLPTIVLSQFLCTSVWFAGNAVMPELIKAIGTAPGFLAIATGAVQLGFVLGTLVFAIFAISDRFPATRVFFLSAIIASLCNLGITLIRIDRESIVLLRFATGFFLAGIYPVGMKIAAEHFKEKLGAALGLLVGALVLGTAFPHLVKSYSQTFSWKLVVQITSILASMGGLAMLHLVKKGKDARQPNLFQFHAFLKGFQIPAFRSAALGYFGHMWELYTFWAFVPIILQAWNQLSGQAISIPLYSFLIIAIGFPSCIISGKLSLVFGAKPIASIALGLSGICCLVSPILLYQTNQWIFLGFLFFWSMMVIADSPLFSTLVASHAPIQSKGSALTIVNCIGFAITIISIQTVQQLSQLINNRFLYLVLAIGPILGLMALRKQNKD